LEQKNRKITPQDEGSGKINEKVINMMNRITLSGSGKRRQLMPSGSECC